MSDYSTDARLMCKKPVFQRYLAVASHRRVINETEALGALKLLLEFNERGELREGTPTGNRWVALKESFTAWKKERPLG
ncbi:MAG: hypothetical protein ACRC8D_07300 [Aeromonas sp.]